MSTGLNLSEVQLLELKVNNLEKEVEKLKSLVDERLQYLESQCQIMTNQFLQK